MLPVVRLDQRRDVDRRGVAICSVVTHHCTSSTSSGIDRSALHLPRRSNGLMMLASQVNVPNGVHHDDDGSHEPDKATPRTHWLACDGHSSAGGRLTAGPRRLHRQSTCGGSIQSSTRRAGTTCRGDRSTSRLHLVDFIGSRHLRPPDLRRVQCIESRRRCRSGLRRVKSNKTSATCRSRRGSSAAAPSGRYRADARVALPPRSCSTRRPSPVGRRRPAWQSWGHTAPPSQVSLV